ncbi:Rne/Rng family ribonuclease [Cytobacillus sp. FJAT-54145]|uniref:Rne/Rng family ribonuclease n=1 Tax=Cytobacillus spartinae TaxID=3299023 RepID=A0ABW6KKT2_9BACI
MDILLVDSLSREKRYALLKNKQVEKLVIEQPIQQSAVGNIYLGTVTKVIPGMNAAFVDIGEEKNGYLHRDKLPQFIKSSDKEKSISSFIHQGEKILVQVEKDASESKGPRLTGILEFKGNSIVYMPEGFYVAVSKKIEDESDRDRWRAFGNKIQKGAEGFLFRTSSMNHSEDEIEAEVESLRLTYKEILRASQNLKKPGLVLEKNSFLDEIKSVLLKMSSGEVIVNELNLKQVLTDINNNEEISIVFHQKNENLFSSYGLNHEIEKALKRIVWLSNGSYLIFDQAEALTVVDVNTGKFLGKSDLRDTVVKTNTLAALEVARQIRLRDLAGIILIDFIDMKEDWERQKVSRALEQALKADDRRTRVIGFTPLGVLQLTRKKTRVSLSEGLTAKCEVCEGTGRVLSAETIAFQLERELWEQKHSDHEAALIETTSRVREVFAGENSVHQNRLEEAIGLKLYFNIVEHTRPFYSIKQYGIEDEIKGKVL